MIFTTRFLNSPNRSHVNSAPTLALELASHDLAWVEAEWQILVPTARTRVRFVSIFEHHGGHYAYNAKELEKADTVPGTWTTVHTYYLTPEMRSKTDVFVTYFWLRDTLLFLVSGPVIKTYKPKDRP